MRVPMMLATDAKELFDVAQEYKSYMLNENLDFEMIIQDVFSFLMCYEYHGDVLKFIVDLCATVSDTTVSVHVDDNNYILQVNTFGDYWGLDIVIGSDVFMVMNGIKTA